MIDLVRAAPFVRLHRDKIMVIKIGGSCLEKPRLRNALANQISVIQAFGAQPVIVHGGGPQTGEVQRLLGEEPVKVDGRRITSETGLRALRWATAGEVNGNLAGALCAAGAKAVGLCAGTGGILTASKRPPRETSQGVVDFGWVGDLESADPAVIKSLLASDTIPVICPPAGDGNGGFLNVNADLAAAAVAKVLCAAKLILITDMPGVLEDFSDPASLLSALSLVELDELESKGSLQDGMSVKAAAIRRALEAGVERVHVVSGQIPEALLGELYTTQGTGTLITKEPQRAPEPAKA